MRGLERAETDARIGVDYRIANEQRSIGQSLSFASTPLARDLMI
jgi:hypothetical protein